MKKLNAILSEKIWGYEQWIASTHPNGLQKDFMEECGKDYPLLVKVIQADDTLSIQVHPNDEFALELEGVGNRGKTECWYVLEAAPDAKIVYGMKNEFPSEVLAKAINENRLEDYLNFVSVKKGDFIFIPAGTVHAIGSGLRLMEVQQSCDLTYRLYDWGRGREVHIEKGLKVLKSGEMIPVAPFNKCFECDYFRLEKIEVNGGWEYTCPVREKPEGVELLYVISSVGAKYEGKEVCSEEIYSVQPGETVKLFGNAELMRIIAK
ncbi:MAG: class I mannose-6-phosphate isomerase [Treponema sp.]|nr:class I mannose-6-phosphate isomerase [Treponema sp.]